MKDDFKIIRFNGWHGTNEDNVEEILETNFHKSRGNHHWLGEGVYFFTEGVGSPIEHARDWAKSEAHKKGNTRFAVLKAEITANDDAVLDLRERKGLALFDTHRKYVLRQLRQTRRNFRIRNGAYCDGKVFEHMQQVAGLEVVIMDVYVKFLQDRIEKIQSRVPNCTFLCVSNPGENISHDTVEIVDRGNI